GAGRPDTAPAGLDRSTRGIGTRGTQPDARHQPALAGMPRKVDAIAKVLRATMAEAVKAAVIPATRAWWAAFTPAGAPAAAWRAAAPKTVTSTARPSDEPTCCMV